MKGYVYGDTHVDTTHNAQKYGKSFFFLYQFTFLPHVAFIYCFWLVFAPQVVKQFFRRRCCYYIIMVVSMRIFEQPIHGIDLTMPDPLYTHTRAQTLTLQCKKNDF